jgi:hypothetical protein
MKLELPTYTASLRDSNFQLGHKSIYCRGFISAEKVSSNSSF